MFGTNEEKTDLAGVCVQEIIVEASGKFLNQSVRPLKQKRNQNFRFFSVNQR